MANEVGTPMRQRIYKYTHITAYTYHNMKIPYHPPYLRDIDTWRLRSLAAHKPLAACCKRMRTTLSGWLCAAEWSVFRPAGREASKRKIRASRAAREAAGSPPAQPGSGPNWLIESRLAQFELVEPVDEPVVFFSAAFVHRMHI